MADSDNVSAPDDLRERTVGLYNALDRPLNMLKDIAEELLAQRAAPAQRTAEDLQAAVVHLGQVRQLLYKVAQEWPPLEVRE